MRAPRSLGAIVQGENPSPGEVGIAGAAKPRRIAGTGIASAVLAVWSLNYKRESSQKLRNCST
jgi:hypothetical protein